MKPVHKILAVILIIALLVSLFFIPEMYRKTQNNNVLYQQLAQCLSYYNSLYENILWSLDYAQKYTVNKEWATLVRARAACTAAKAAVIEEPLPDNMVSTEQYLELLHNNVDSDLVYALWEDIQEEDTQVIQIIHSLDSFLYEQIHFYEMSPRIELWITDCRTYIQAHCEYLTLITNYLLLQMDKESWWKPLSKQLPTVFSFNHDWLIDETLVAERYTEAYEESNACYLRMEDLESICSYAERLESIAESIGHNPSVHDVMAPYMWKVPEIPAYFPMPEWLENTFPGKLNIIQIREEVREEFENELDRPIKENRSNRESARSETYVYAEESDSAEEEIPETQITSTWEYAFPDSDSQETHILSAGDEIQGIPDYCRITVQHLPKEEMENYRHLLEEFGFIPSLQTSGDEKEIVLEVNNNSCYLRTIWTEQETVILMTDSVGCLIPATYLRAINKQ